MVFRRALRFVVGLTAMIGAASANADQFKLNGQTFTTPSGYVLEQVAGTPHVKRPVSAAFDDLGRLYVTDSSGSNEPVAVQRNKRPHRIVRLVDRDGDGRYESSTVFADRLMFPEGALWHRGSLYVAAPPEIWKFTDKDDDGVAESREVWFDGKTLTHCANDLHGPYLGLDGWFYWCKGAFATQTYERVGKPPMTTKAAHLFRRRPEGGPIEAVMTGGMDNPVEVVFTPGGERIFTTTFLIHPSQGRRDGLIHAVYGGVYGKDHSAITGHPRTGELMPPLAHLGAAAPCGLARLRSNGLGEGFQGNVLATLFNMHKVTRHEPSYRGASLHVQTSDLLVSDHLDFHPTDVLEDADGSLLIVDTGGWFRLCCPTSQLEKPEVLGAIYRLRRKDLSPIADPRGRKIAWAKQSHSELAMLLDDPRHAVRDRALRTLAERGDRAVDALVGAFQSESVRQRTLAVWALTRIDSPRAREAVRSSLQDPDPTVRQASLHSVSVRRDKEAAEAAAKLIARGPARVRRAAAEALGRIGEARHIAALMRAVDAASANPQTIDRVLEHSLTYAAMELDAPAQLAAFKEHASPRVRRAALIALDQAEGGSRLTPGDIRDLLVSDNPVLNDTAWWIAERHPDWGDTVVDALRVSFRNSTSHGDRVRDHRRLQRFVGTAGVQELMSELLRDAETAEVVRRIVMNTIASSRNKPPEWVALVADQLNDSHSAKVRLTALETLRSFDRSKLDDAARDQLRGLAADKSLDASARLRALAVLPPARRWNASSLDFVCDQLSLESSVENRALAVDILTASPLSSGQLVVVANRLPATGVMELKPLMAVFAKRKDPLVGKALVDALLRSPAADSLLPDALAKSLAGYGDGVAAQAKPLMERVERRNQNKLQQVQAVLALLPKADAKRGLQVFQSSQASCLACHKRGYLGGDIGPDLNRIGRIRSERDLIESILFPSLSLVRSYEPVSLVTEDGRVLNGLIRGEDSQSLTLQLDAQKQIRVPKATIEQRRMGDVSIMPAGLDKQLKPQDFADLIRYLKED